MPSTARNTSTTPLTTPAFRPAPPAMPSRTPPVWRSMPKAISPCAAHRASRCGLTTAHPTSAARACGSTSRPSLPTASPASRSSPTPPPAMVAAALWSISSPPKRFCATSSSALGPQATIARRCRHGYPMSIAAKSSPSTSMPNTTTATRGVTSRAVPPCSLRKATPPPSSPTQPIATTGGTAAIST